MSGQARAGQTAGDGLKVAEDLPDPVRRVRDRKAVGKCDQSLLGDVVEGRLHTRAEPFVAGFGGSPANRVASDLRRRHRAWTRRRPDP